MKTKLHFLLKIPYVTAVIAIGVIRTVQAANIVWVSDSNDNATGFFGPLANQTDSAYVSLLQNAGHNVIRYNQPNGQATSLTPAELAALNTNDLIIVGRAVNSGAFQPVQGNQWNVAITKPLMDISPYHVRTASSRLGWFAGDTSDNFDDTPSVLGAVITGNPLTDAVVDYLFAGVAMIGTNTALPYDEAIDRNTSQIAGAPVTGSVIYARVSYGQFNNATATNSGNAIVGFPAGTAVRGGVDILGGYRMFFATGSRESGIFPSSVQIYAGRENLSPSGEDIFLRAVQVALNNGTAPLSDPLALPGIASQPVSVTVLEGRPAAFSVTVTGAAPRTVEWQRDTGDGVTFATIPEATTPFSKSQYGLPAVSLTDNAAKFRVVATNPNGTVTSDVVTLAVTEDMQGPTALGAWSLDGNSITVYFNEALDQTIAEFTFNYAITADSGSSVDLATLQPDRRSVLLAVSPPLSPNFSINITEIADVFLNAITPVDVAGINHGLTGVSVGSPTPLGGGVAVDNNTFEVSGAAIGGGGGSLANDIQPATENFQFAYKSVEGDFDARVRVNSITAPASAPARLESVAKAILGARATTDGNSVSVNAFVTTPFPGDSSYGATARTATGAATSSNFVSVAYSPGAIPAAFPAWLRVKRAGDVFTIYRSANGTDWTQYGSTTVAMGPTALVGVGAASHRNGQLAVARFSDFQIIQAPAQPTILNPTYAGGTFSGSFQTQNGFSYRVVYKDDLSAATWSLLTTIPGDGAVQPFSDLTPHPNQRFYRIEILP